MLVDSLESAAKVAGSAVLAYAALILILRASGKRSLAKLNIFDWAVTVAFGSALATVILSRDVPLADGIVGFAMLALLQYVVSKTSIHSRAFAGLVRSSPVLLVENGRYLEQAMRKERVTASELDAVIRNQGIGRIAEVAALVMETDGSFSVIRKSGEGELSALRSVERIGS